MRKTRKTRGEPLYQRGGVWWARVRDRTGRVVRRSTHCKDKDAAWIEFKNFEREAVDQKYGCAAEATLSECLQDYYDDLARRGVSKATRGIAEQKCGHFVRLWENEGRSPLPMAKIDAALVHDYIDKRQREDVVDFTIKKELGQLGQVLTLAIHHGKYHLALAQVMPPFFSGKHKPRNRKLTIAEASKLLAQFDDRRAAHLAFILATGARLSESFRAQRSDVDWEKRVVHVRGSKTTAADDDVPITLLTEKLLTWAIDHAPGRTVLYHPWGKIQRDVAAACERAGIPRMSPNDLRRSFGWWHRLSGVSVDVVARMLRHTTDKLAQTTYARLGGPELSTLVAGQLTGTRPVEAPSGDLFAALAARGWRGVKHEARTGGLVYFVCAEGGDRIKIGKTRDLTRRLLSLRAHSPTPLVVLATEPGGLQREAELHAKFAPMRLHGEWFRAEPELLDYIATLAVPNLYREPASTASTGDSGASSDSGIAQNTAELVAPPGEVESPTFGLGNRRHSLSHERRSAGTKKGIERARALAAGVGTVPNLYAEGTQEIAASDEPEPPALTGRWLSSAPWLAAASSALCGLLSARAVSP